MAISSESVRAADQAGNNSTSTPYAIPFAFLSNADVIIVVRTSAGVETQLVEITDYVIAGSGYPTASASFTTLVAVPVTSTVIIYRRTAVTQTTQYIEADGFPAASHERAIDKLTMQEQEGKDIDAHSFRIKDTRGTIAALTPVNNALVGLDPAGVPLMKTASEVLTWLQLVQTLGNFPTKTWLNAAERATAVPDFIGQVGVQRDTARVYIGTALTAGSWSLVVGDPPGAMSVTTAMLQDGIFTADAAGRLKMAAAFLMATHLNADAVSGQTADTLLDDTDSLLGYNGSALRKYAGDVVVPPGSVIQTQYAEYTANADILTTIPYDDTIPQNTEGTEILSRTITPRFSDSQILLTFQGFYSISVTTHGICSLFRDSISNALAAEAGSVITGGLNGVMALAYLDSPATVGPVTYKIRVGPQNAGTLRMNGTPTARVFGGASRATLVAQEIKV